MDPETICIPMHLPVRLHSKLISNGKIQLKISTNHSQTKKMHTQMVAHLSVDHGLGCLTSVI